MNCNKSGTIGKARLERLLAFQVCLFIAAAGVLFCPLMGIPKAAAETDKSYSRRVLHDGANHRKVRVGLYENKPKIFTDESGEASGIFPVILNEIARKENWQLIYVPCEWSNCVAALEKGHIDLLPDVAFSAERDNTFDFHAEEVVCSWSVLYAGEGKEINNISDLNGRRIAVLKGSIQQTILQQMAKGFDLNISLINAKSFSEAFSFTADGSADGVVSNHFFGDCFYQQYGLEKTPVVFNAVSLYFATASGTNADLLKAIDNNLKTMKAQAGSVYYKVLQRWMEKPPHPVIPRYIIGLLCGVSGLFLLAVIFVFLLRRQIRAGTRKLAQANQMLRENEKKFRDLFHKHSAAKIVIDPRSGHIIEANQAAEKFYGWSRQELLRMRIQDIATLPPERVEEGLEKSRQNKQSRFESRHRLADDSIKDVEVFSSRVEIDGKTFLYYLILDITEYRQLEEQYRQAQKMESVGRLAGGVAHDYNNMLSLIIGHAELALEEVGRNEPVYEDLKTILSAAKRSADITRQLLAFARQQDIVPRILDLNATVTDLLKMLQRLIGEDIDLVWNPGENLWPVKMDPAQANQLLANLCVNARDAIANVGRLTIETKNVVFDETYCADHAGFSPGEYVMLAVSDNGCGMDKATLDQIFEPFFTTKEIGQGTGLGLATVYGIVKQNGGFINVYSESQKGTTFHIYLSRHTGKAEKVQWEGSAEILPGGGETILVVEDEEAILHLTRKILEGMGYIVVTAGSPQEALRLAEEHNGAIHLLITDVIMPDMNGRELAERMQALYPNLKCLFMSGYTANVIAHHGVLEEGVNFIQKPASRKDLAAKVRETLDKSA